MSYESELRAKAQAALDRKRALETRVFDSGHLATEDELAELKALETMYEGYCDLLSKFFPRKPNQEELAADAALKASFKLY